MTNNMHVATTKDSFISTLAAERAAVLRAAESDGGRDLTADERMRMTVWASAIAVSVAQTPAEAAVQLEIAREHAELIADDAVTPDAAAMRLYEIDAALRSALPVICAAIGYQPVSYPAVAG